jgi:hypothetical protein
MRKNEKRKAFLSFVFGNTLLSNIVSLKTFTIMATTKNNTANNANNGNNANNNANNGNNGNNTANGNIDLSQLLQKFAEDSGITIFSADSVTATDAIAAQAAREFPDFGRDLPEGTYKVTAQMAIKKWRSPKTGKDSNIYVAVALDTNNVPVFIPFACFSKPEYEFIRPDNSVVEMHQPIEHISTTSRRNDAVRRYILSEPTVTLHHAMGHPNNPYTERIWDRITTWIEEKA